MQDRWRRYRAFTAGVESPSDKKTWLPQGPREWDEDYTLRVKLTHNLGWSRWAVRRLGGVLTKHPTQVTFEAGSKLPEETRGRILEFVAKADGTRRSLASWWGDMEPEVLAMGIGFAEVSRHRLLDAPTPAEEPLPYLSNWKAEECVDWRTDDRGDLEWVVLRRFVTERTEWQGAQIQQVVYRILTRTQGIEQRYDATDERHATPVSEAAWDHNLGIVPLVPIYALRLQPLQGESYIDQISLADLRILQLESDQSHASYQHGSPALKVWTTADPEQLALGSSHALHLNPGGQGQDREDAQYLTLDTAGMQIREAIVDRTLRQALTVAGIDPNTVIGPGGAGAGPRSGASIAWSFSTSEAPTLNGFAEEMDAADRMILEIVARYLTPGEPLPSHESLFDGQVSRTKEWDLMAATDAVDLGTQVYDLTPSETHRRAILRDLARKVPAGLTADLLTEIDDEVLAADVAKPEPLDMTDVSEAENKAALLEPQGA